MDAFEAISLSESSSRIGKKYFTVAEANRSLILIHKIVADIVRDYRRLRELHDSYQQLEAQDDVFDAEQTRQEYIGVADRLSELREELEEIGCELKDYEGGLVDFPARLDDREVYLCWKLGEEKVEHWHEINTGYSSRKAITTEAI